MLWLTGILSALKGMVKVPDVVGKTTETATSDILAAYLTNTGNTTENTTDTNLGGKVKEQSPSANTLVEYDTNVSYISYLFSFTPYSFTPSTPYSFTPSPPPCSPLYGIGCGVGPTGPLCCYYSGTYDCNGNCTGLTLDFCIC